MNARLCFKRDGFALMAVVIISAILVVSAAMLTTQLFTEGRVTKSNALFKSALNVSEEGLNTTLSLIRTVKDAPDGTAWVDHLAAQVAAVVNGQAVNGKAPNPVVVSGIAERNGLRGAYRVVVVVVDSPAPQKAAGSPETVTDADGGSLTTVTDTWTVHVQVASVGAVYPATVDPMITSGVLAEGFSARRAVRTTSVVTYTDTRRNGTIGDRFDKPADFPIDFAILTGGDLSISGSSQEIDGDVFAAQDVYVQKSDGIVDGHAFAGGTVTGKAPVGSLGGQSVPEFPDVDAWMPYYKQMHAAYLAGSKPYDGSDTSHYTDTRHYLDDGSVNPNFAKYHIAELTANPSDFRYFTDQTAVYYVDRDLDISSNASMTGTVAVDADIFISGSIDMASGGSLPTIITTGDITKEAGCSYIKGVLIAGGTVTGRGTSDVYGAIICRESVDLKGNYTIRFDGSLSSIPGGDGTFIEGGEYTGVSEYGLDDMALPSPEDRVWQEFTPAS